ncbi:hypothetical protein K435DRAFT_837994 [Dendrothele bispora CBS 962.96]|uniref:Uncharacterized protein n=1 Tax=Dendrothele bispora (strain CBS 962.96) TaxID=1314807 RepID=A0A4S8M977_DENBC|nr:hypothetical protein K435DRAFT_837994 [Dendrothele bispora CBS 962.96]
MGSIRFSPDSENGFSLDMIKQGLELLASTNAADQHAIIVAGSPPWNAHNALPSNLETSLVRYLAQKRIQCHLMVNPYTDMSLFTTVFDENLRSQPNLIEKQVWFPVDTSKITLRISGQHDSPIGFTPSQSAQGLHLHNNNKTCSRPAGELNYIAAANLAAPHLTSGSLDEQTSLHTSAPPPETTGAQHQEPGPGPSLVAQLQQVHGLTKKKVYGTKPVRKPFVSTEVYRQREGSRSGGRKSISLSPSSSSSSSPTNDMSHHGGRVPSSALVGRSARLYQGAPMIPPHPHSHSKSATGAGVIDGISGPSIAMPSNHSPVLIHPSYNMLGTSSPSPKSPEEATSSGLNSNDTDSDVIPSLGNQWSPHEHPDHRNRHSSPPSMWNSQPQTLNVTGFESELSGPSPANVYPSHQPFASHQDVYPRASTSSGPGSPDYRPVIVPSNSTSLPSIIPSRSSSIPTPPRSTTSSTSPSPSLNDPVPVNRLGVHHHSQPASSGSGEGPRTIQNIIGATSSTTTGTRLPHHIPRSAYRDELLSHLESWTRIGIRVRAEDSRESHSSFFLGEFTIVFDAYDNNVVIGSSTTPLNAHAQGFNSQFRHGAMMSASLMSNWETTTTVPSTSIPSVGQLPRSVNTAHPSGIVSFDNGFPDIPHQFHHHHSLTSTSGATAIGHGVNTHASGGSILTPLTISNTYSLPISSELSPGLGSSGNSSSLNGWAG